MDFTGPAWEGVYWINPLNPIRHLLALVGARHIVHVSRIRVKYEAQTALFKDPVRTAQ